MVEPRPAASGLPFPPSSVIRVVRMTVIMVMVMVRMMVIMVMVMVRMKMMLKSPIVVMKSK